MNNEKLNGATEVFNMYLGEIKNQTKNLFKLEAVASAIDSGNEVLILIKFKEAIESGIIPDKYKAYKSISNLTSINRMYINNTIQKLDKLVENLEEFKESLFIEYAIFVQNK